MSTYVLRRAADRFRTTGEGRDTRHCFSFGAHYDPADVGFGALVACNDERLEPGAGYGTHLHRDTEIVTWVVQGELTHRDPTGRPTVVRPGSIQWLSAGSGVEHSERNESAEPMRFVQAWLRPSVVGSEPGYVLRDVRDLLGSAEVVPVLDVGSAVLHAAQLPGGSAGLLPEAPLVHVLVACGSGRLDDLPEPLEEGDCLRITDCSGGRVVGGARGLELLVWAMPR